jgi:hypothetical protein
MKALAPALAGILASAAYPAALAVDVDSLSEGAPVAVDDAGTPDPGTVELVAPFEVSRKDSGDESLGFTPKLKFGVARDWEASVSMPLLAGSADRTGSGDLRAAAKWNFLKEQGYRPALAAQVALIAPTGRGTDGLDTELQLLATKTLPGAVSQHVHLNASLLRNSQQDGNERRYRNAYVVGYDRRLAANLLGVADFVYAHDRERGGSDRLVEVGARYQLSNSDVVGLGVGLGVGSSETDWRIGVSYQLQF